MLEGDFSARGLVALKRLAAVEVDPERSHQHELNAGELRGRLGFPPGRTEGVLNVALHSADGDEPQLRRGRFTLYDSREAHPSRSEYRLYYETVLFDGAREGDLLVLYRPTGARELHAVIVPPGSAAESELLHALSAGGIVDMARFVYVDPPTTTTESAELALDAVTGAHSVAEPAAEYGTLVSDSIAAGALPDTRAMARAGGDLADARAGADADPDVWLTAALEGETELWMAIQDGLLRPQLAELVAQDASVADVLAWAMRAQQSARSRRGESVQNHFGRLLERREIPHTPQCVTEAGRRPDFMVPGCREYHDPAFPAHALRMVACKSTVRERWAQILAEADRISPKYLLTLDPRLTAATIADMRARSLLPFLPRPVIDGHYAANAARAELMTVAALIERLEDTSGARTDEDGER